MKLSTKLPLLVIPLLAVPMLLIGLLAYQQLKESAQTKGQQEIQVLMDSLQNQLNQLTEAAEANVSIFADDPLLKSYMLNGNLDERYTLMQRPLQNKLASIQHVYPDYYEIRVLQPNGFEDLRLTNRDIPNRSEEEADNPGFISMQQADTDTLSRILINPDNQEPALYVSRRIRLLNLGTDPYNAEPRLRGYLSLTISLQPLIELLSTTPWGGAELLLTTSRHSVLSTSLDAHQARLPLEDFITIIKEQPQGSTGVEFRGQHYLHYSRQLHPDLQAHLLLPKAELLQESRNIGRLVLMVCLGAIILSVPLLLLLFRHQFLKPVQRLNQALANLGHSRQLIQLPIQNDDEIGELSLSFNRMSMALQKSNERIRTLAFQDSLTGLANRLMFIKMVRRAIDRSKKNQTQFAVLFLDLDNFKQINDTHGHPSGDKLLTEVAHIIQSRLRADDSLSGPFFSDDDSDLARFGGDEFTLLLRDMDCARDVASVAERLIHALSQPIDLNGISCYTGCSIGIALYPEDGSSVEELIKHADLAMYQAKSTGKGNYQFFSKPLATQSQQQARIIQRLHHAVEDDVFELFYQPIIDNHSRKLVSVEALIRWKDAELGVVSPAVFIPLAEKNGLIQAIGNWVLEEAARQLQAWKTVYGISTKVAVNISSIQLQQPEFAHQITELLTRYRLDSQDLYIELTETALLQGQGQDQELVMNNLHELHRRGISIALDDFGTGYSSLSYLQNLPIDILKIDRSFIINLQENNNGAILSAIITMAHSLGMKVVAEGVEDQRHLAFLTAEGCDLLQGYLFGRPGPASDITAWFTLEASDNQAYSPA